MKALQFLLNMVKSGHREMEGISEVHHLSKYKIAWVMDKYHESKMPIIEPDKPIMSEAYNRLMKNNPHAKEFQERVDKVTSIEEAEIMLIQRYGFCQDGSVNCEEQLFIFSIMEGIKSLNKREFTSDQEKEKQ